MVREICDVCKEEKLVRENKVSLEITLHMYNFYGFSDVKCCKNCVNKLFGNVSKLRDLMRDFNKGLE